MRSRIPNSKFKILTRNGGELASILYESLSKTTKKPPLVILCHGFTGDKYEWGRFPKTAKKINDLNWDAIIFDFSGSGENKREPVLLSKQVRDLEDIYDWAKKQGYSTFATIGLSFGGLTTLVANLPVCTNIFWAPAFYVSRSMKESQIDNFPVKLTSACPPEIYFEEDFIHELDQIDVDENLQKFRTPSLIIQGESDNVVRPEQSERALTQMPQDPHHRLHVVKNADHLFNGDQLEEFIEETIRWLQKYL